MDSCALTIPASLCAAPREALWFRHAIDSFSRGADGVRPAAFHADGWPDLVTG